MKKNETNISSNPSSRQMHARAAIGPWDIKMPPIKKHMVAGHLVPALGTTTRLFNQKHRRVSLEVLEPTDEKGGLPVTRAWDPDNDTLNDKDEVVLRFFRKVKKKDLSGLNSKQAEDTTLDEDEQSVSTLGDDDSDENQVWRLHSHHRSDDVEILNVHGRTVDIKLGSGHDTVIRDLKFEKEEHATSFKTIVEKTKNLEHERAKRQVAAYRAKKATSPKSKDSDDATGAKIMQQSPRDISAVLEEGDDEMIKILAEIVSANNLPVADLSSSDAYVIVRFNGKEIHRTKVISNNLDPIWSLRTGSLFILQMTPEEFFSASSGMLFVIKDYDSVGSNEILGRVNVALEDVLDGTGERIGYDVVPQKPDEDITMVPVETVAQARRPVVEAAGKMPKGAGLLVDASKGKLLATKKDKKKKVIKDAKPAETDSKRHPKLFLRFKNATDDDIAFMDAYKNNSKAFGLYANETFVPIRKQGSKLLRRQTKRGPNKEVLHRVRPGPDPDRPVSETEWLTNEQIQNEAEKLSTHWIEAGSGNLGKLYLEIIGCDGLPNMDAASLNIGDKTDAFLNICFEDSILNTEVIADCLSPRFPCWTQRAFVFNIAHPSSDVFIGVFDHDPERSPVQQLASTSLSDVHDSIGRVVVKAQKFMPDTNYVLTYPLYYGELAEHRMNSHGTLTVRLRIEYSDMRKALIAGMKPPPESVVSVARKIDYRTGLYTVQGVHDDTQFSLSTLTGYVEELQSYKPLLYLLKDALMNVWLWRGHFPVVIRGETHYLPFHSMIAFVWGILVTWNWNLFPSFFVFALGWALWACNEHVNRHPSRWHNAPSYRDLARRLLTNTTASETVNPNANAEQATAYEKRIEDLMKRREHEMQKEAENELKLQAELGAEMENAEEAEQDSGKYGGIFRGVSVNPLKPVLYPVQMKLRKVIYSVRITRSIVLWNECYYAFWLANACFLTSFVFFFIPFGFILRWTMRIIAFVALGPWNAIIDRVYFRKDPNMTDEEKDEELRLRLKARYQEVLQSATNFFIRKENAIKMKDMKQFMFGKFLLRVPRFCEDLYEDYPLPISYCNPVDVRISVPVSERKYGQRLFGDMIPQREINFTPVTTAPKAKKKFFWQKKRRTQSETTPLLQDAADGKKYT